MYLQNIVNDSDETELTRNHQKKGYQASVKFKYIYLQLCALFTEYYIPPGRDDQKAKKQFIILTKQQTPKV